MSLEQENFDMDFSQKTESDLEQYGVWVKKSLKDEMSPQTLDDELDSPIDIPEFDTLDDIAPVVDEINTDSFFDADTTLSTSELTDLTNIVSSTDSIEISDEISLESNEDFDIPVFSENITNESDFDSITTSDVIESIETPLEPMEFSLPDFADMNLDFESEVDTREVQSEENTSPSDTLPSDTPTSDEVDVSDFLTEDFSENTESISLDSFIEKEEKDATVFEESNPLDINLSFDDDFSLKSQADPSEHVESEGFDTVSFETEETAPASDDFDSMFDSITDEATPEKAEINASALTSAPVSFDEVTEFDDILSEIDSSEEPAAPESAVQPTAEKTEAKEVTYNLRVIADDDIDETTETTEEEKDFIPQENTTPYSPTETTVTGMSAELYDKLLSELSNLRSEITNLKTELDDIKLHPVVEHIPVPAPCPETTQSKAEESAVSGGFFADDESDDTIALSGDDLNNILNNADFTVENAIEPESSVFDEEILTEDEFLSEDEIEIEPSVITVDDLLGSEPTSNDIDNTFYTEEENEQLPSLDVGETNLVEPQLDDIDFGIDDELEVPDELPEEIQVPVLEDLIVDSSSTNFFEEESDLSDANIDYLSEKNIDESVEDNSDFELDEIPQELPEELDISVEEIQSEEDDFSNKTFDLHTAEDIPEVIEEPSEELAGEPEVEAMEEEPTEEVEIELPPEVEIEPEIEVELAPEVDVEPEIEIQQEEELGSNDTMENTDSPVDTSHYEIDTTASDTVFDSSQWNVLGDSVEQNFAPQLSEQEEDIFEEEKEPVIADEEPVQNADSTLIPKDMKEEIKSVLSYMDQLLENLPEEKIAEFAQSEYFETYKKLFSELGLS